MHELSICSDILRVAASEMQQLPRGSRLTTVRVAAGAWRQIVPEFLQTAFRASRPGTVAEHAELEVRTLPLHIACRGCGWRGDSPGRTLVCPACGSGDTAMSGGGELIVESLEIEENGTY